MARQRDYKAEYSRRIQKGRARGLSRSQARGHGRPTKAYDRQLEEGLKELRSGKSLSAAARTAHVAAERLRTYLGQTGVVEKQRGRWTVMEDFRPRFVPIWTNGQEREVKVRGYEEARIAGEHRAVVQNFMRTNDRSLLRPFEGVSIPDDEGKLHLLETRPNVLYRIHAQGTEPYEQVYRIVA